MITTLPKIRIQTSIRKRLADTLTPVSVYLKLRDHYQQAVLLESNDFRSAENCFSYIGLDPIAGASVQSGQLELSYPNGHQEIITLQSPQGLPAQLQAFVQSFDQQGETDPQLLHGLFGYTTFDAVQYFDTFQLDPKKRVLPIPELRYHYYRFIIAFDHFRNQLYLMENLPEGEASQLEALDMLLQGQGFATYPFELVGDQRSNMTDEHFMDLVRKGKEHCQLGDVFQIVFARRYEQDYRGDDFNVYRQLRSVNPSPYLFYFDFGGYRIFGSSPEAQLVIKDGIASVNPISGTYKRTGNDEEDRLRAGALARDPKENAEHIMLVDLARNDLGRHAEEVTVAELKEIQFFSHVIHLVSRVEGQLQPDFNPLQVFGDTFPAGTLSGAPKYKAIELIHEYEQENRSFYGGGIGYIGLNGDMNQAIVIRSFLSYQNTLYYQAGAGIVAASVPESELAEVGNKLGALNRALEEAQTLVAKK
ncbi:MAG: anthranilate synthase component I family protein [Bacteroidota bacterium]